MEIVIALLVLLTVSVNGDYNCGRDATTFCLNGDCDKETGQCTNCDSGFSGYDCIVVDAEKTHEDCSPNPCENGGTCWKGASTGGVTKCLCDEKWTGPTCTQRVYGLSCSYSGDGSMSMTLRPQGDVNGVIFIKGIDPDNQTSCVFTGNPPELLALSHMDSTCGPAPKVGTEYKRDVLILFKENTMTSQDEIVTFICGESDTVVISAEDGVIVNALDSAFLPVTKSLAPLTEDLDMLLLGTDGMPVDTVTMGTLITLEVDLTEAGDIKFDGVLLESCVAGTHADPTDPDYDFNFFIENYCPSTELDDQVTTEVTVNGTRIYFEFLAFKYMDYSTVYIRCSVEPCEVAGDCNLIDCSGAKRRKKRETGSEKETLQRSFSIIDPQAIASLKQQLDNDNDNDKRCYQTWEMTATVVALAVALAIVLIICIFLIVKVIASKTTDKGKSYRGDLSETSSTAHFPNLPTIVSNKC